MLNSIGNRTTNLTHSLIDIGHLDTKVQTSTKKKVENNKKKKKYIYPVW